MSADVTRPVAAQDVSRFVGEVRGHLGDLPADVVEDLVGGLEADLLEAVADGEPLPADPARYAADLRVGAGLDAPGPEAAGATRSRRRSPTRQEVRARLEELAAPVTSAPWWPAVRDFLVALRPVWWVLRGFALGWLLTGAPSGAAGDWDLLAVLAVGALVVASVQVGRGGWSPAPGWQHRVLLGAGAVAVLVTPSALAGLGGPGTVYYEQSSTGTGLYRDGEPVTNVYPYDAQGRPLVGVQLFDQEGRPLDVEPGTAHEDGDSLWFTVPGTDARGVERRNLVPLWDRRESRWTDDGREVVGPLRQPQPPLVAVPPVVAPAPSPTPSATPTATPTASAPGS